MPRPVKKTFAEKKAEAAAQKLEDKRRKDKQCLEEWTKFNNELNALQKSKVLYLKAKEQAKAKQNKGKECMSTIEEEDDVY